jgi:hypothetical protein
VELSTSYTPYGLAPGFDGAGFAGAGAGSGFVVVGPVFVGARSAGGIGFGTVTVSGGAFAGAFALLRLRRIVPESMVFARSEIVWKVI